jgi:hypothetical protein
MGLSMDQINAGMAGVGTLINQSMDAWDRIKQSTGGATATPPIAAGPTGGSVQTQPAAASTTTAPGGLNLGALALFGIGAIILLKVLK